MIPVKSFRERRSRLATQMHRSAGGVAIVPTAPERVRNRDAHYPYRFDSYFYYLTGFTEPEAVLVIVADANGEAEKHILFCRDKDPSRKSGMASVTALTLRGRHSALMRRIPFSSWMKCFLDYSWISLPCSVHSDTM